MLSLKGEASDQSAESSQTHLCSGRRHKEVHFHLRATSLYRRITLEAEWAASDSGSQL